MTRILFDSWFTEPCGELVKGSTQDTIPKSHVAFFSSGQTAAQNKAIIGWGGIVLLGNENHTSPSCMVALITEYMNLIRQNSCGKCVPCRVGTTVIYQKLVQIRDGQAEAAVVNEILNLSHDIRSTCKCSYGIAFDKPLRDAITYFTAEFIAHASEQKKCHIDEAAWFMTAPCNHGCPANTDAARYIELITEEKFFTGNSVAYEPDTFASCMGRACFHPCETLCRRGKVDQPIAISYLKRSVTDYQVQGEREQTSEEPVVASKKTSGKVAVVGAGPAGAQCASDLARWDYDVTIFEATAVVGGVAYLGIPEYRLPRDIVNRELERVQRQGVTLHMNTRVGKELFIDDLFKEGYEAVFIGIGCHKGRKMGITDEDTFEGVMDAIEFLREINLGRMKRLPDNVIVVGGGNTAIDSVRISRHMGARNVTLSYRRSREEMPASAWEVDEAEHEGVKLEFLTAPVGVEGKDGKVTGVILQRMKLGEPDKSGRRRPVPIEGSEFVIKADLIVAAVSQDADMSYFNTIKEMKITKWNTFEVNEDTMQTSIPNIFAGGDVAIGPMSIIDAAATGRKAAVGIDKYISTLRGRKTSVGSHEKFDTMLRMRKIINALGMIGDEVDADIPARPREPMPMIPPAERFGNFDEVDLGYDRQTALAEASRCMRCYRIIMTLE